MCLHVSQRGVSRFESHDRARAGELLLLQDLIENIPQAVFGGILIKVGADTFDWAPLRFYCKNLWWSVVGSRRSTTALQTKYAAAVAVVEQAAVEQDAIETGGGSSGGGKEATVAAATRLSIESVPDWVSSTRSLPCIPP